MDAPRPRVRLVRPAARVKKVPCVVMEEHHEAFYFWREAVLNGTLPGKGCSLVHIDEHSDMDLPTLQRPMPGKDASLEETRAFILRELNIANFIWPALLGGTFSEVWWHRDHETTQPYDGPVSVFTTDVERRALVWSKGPLPDFLAGKEDAAQARFARVRELEEIAPKGPVVLDICLDYFSCNLTPERPDVALEVTDEEFERYRSDPYHLLRIAPGAPVTPTDRDGRKLLVFGRASGRGEGRTADRDAALARLARLESWLDAKDLDCRLIDVSLSKISGYTPEDLCDELLERLGAVLHKRFGAALEKRSAFDRCPA